MRHTSTDHAAVRDRLAVAVREAGALALLTFRGEIKSWTKGASSPVSEADLAVDALLRERLSAHPRRRLAVGRDRGRSGAVAAPRRVGGRPHRRHARLSRGPCRLGGVGGAGERGPSGRRRALCAGDRRIVPGDRRRRRDAQRRADRRRARAMRSRARSSPAPSGAWTLWRRSSRTSRRCRGFRRWRCVWRALQPARSTAPSPDPTAMIGTLRRPTFWCTKPAGQYRL